MEQPRAYQDLVAWQKAHQLIFGAYRLTSVYPSGLRFGLAQQTRCAAVSAAANIAEGFRRTSLNHFIFHLDMAQVSLEEAKYHLLLARDLGFIKKRAHDTLHTFTEDVGKLLFRPIESLGRKRL